MKSTDIFICCSCIAVFLFCHTFIITVLINMHLRQFSRVRKTRKISDAEFHTLMGWIMMHYLLGLL